MYSATVTLDGRAPITDWQDPMLVGLTLFSIVLVGLTVVVLWPRLGGGGAKGRRRLGPDRRPVVVHLRRDTLQHDLTIGEPPQDISSLFEIAGSAVVLVGAVAAAVLYARERARAVLGTLAVVLFVGMGWWFTHPIDQSQPGGPGAHVRQSRLQRVPLGQEAMSVEERQR